MDGVREGLHYGGGAPRLVAEELGGGQRPDFSSLQESVGPGDGVGHDRLGTGVHPLQHSEHSEREQGMHTRQAPRLASEPGEHDTREAGRREGGLCTGEGRCWDTASVARASPTPSVSAGEPLELGNVGAAGGRRDSATQPAMGDKGDRQMRLRPQGEKADEDIDQSASLDPEGQDREWALQGREVHGMAITSSGQTEHPGQTCPNSKEKKLDTEGRKEESAKRREGSKKRARGGTDCRDVRNDTVNTNTARSVDWACGPNVMDDDTREARGSHGDETKEAIEKADQRSGIERRQGGDGARRCRHG